MENADIPRIEVSVEFRGQTVKHIGGQFIDAIRFLCEAEKSVRDSLGLKVECDPETDKLQKANLLRLLEKGIPAS